MRKPFFSPTHEITLIAGRSTTCDEYRVLHDIFGYCHNELNNKGDLIARKSCIGNYSLIAKSVYEKSHFPN